MKDMHKYRFIVVFIGTLTSLVGCNEFRENPSDDQIRGAIASTSPSPSPTGTPTPTACPISGFDEGNVAIGRWASYYDPIPVPSDVDAVSTSTAVSIAFTNAMSEFDYYIALEKRRCEMRPDGKFTRVGNPRVLYDHALPYPPPPIYNSNSMTLVNVSQSWQCRYDDLTVGLTEDEVHCGPSHREAWVYEVLGAAIHLDDPKPLSKINYLLNVEPYRSDCGSREGILIESDPHADPRNFSISPSWPFLHFNSRTGRYQMMLAHERKGLVRCCVPIGATEVCR